MRAKIKITLIVVWLNRSVSIRKAVKTVCKCFILVSPGLLQSMLDSVLPA